MNTVPAAGQHRHNQSGCREHRDERKHGRTHAGRFDSPSPNPVRFVVEFPAHASFNEALAPSAKLPRRARVRSASRAAQEGDDRAEAGALEEATTLSFISVTGRCISAASMVCSAYPSAAADPKRCSGSRLIARRTMAVTPRHAGTVNARHTAARHSLSDRLRGVIAVNHLEGRTAHQQRPQGRTQGPHVLRR